MILALLASAAVSAVAPTSAPPGVPPAPTKGAATLAIEEQWTASSGAALSATLTSWAQRAGWTVVWETEDDFRLAAGATLDGDFPTVADRLIQAFGNARPRLRAVFYGGNKVLRVWTERNEP